MLYCVPPFRQIGTSAPILLPIAQSASVSSFLPNSSFSATSVPAPSTEEPPIPPISGTCFSISTEISAVIPATSKKAFAAFHTIFLSSQGIWGVSQVILQPKLSVLRTRTVISSYTSTLCVAIFSECLPLGSLPVISRYKFSFAYTLTFIFIDYSTPRSSRNSFMRSSAVLIC